jgi:hypothetical protein
METTYHLVETFLQMVRERKGERLDAWLIEAEASGLEALQSFVSGIRQDKDAVLAGLTLPWSNGPTEGQVNRLKLIKRSMYGRAQFALLRLRVLHQRDKKQSEKMKSTHQQRQGGDKERETAETSLTPQHSTFLISKVA